MIGLIKTAKLWAKTSEKSGRSYPTGRWGGCRVLVFENDLATGAEGEPTHWLMLGDAEHGRQPMSTGGPAQRVDQVAGDRTAEFFLHGRRARARGQPVMVIFQSGTHTGVRPREGWHGD